LWGLLATVGGHRVENAESAMGASAQNLTFDTHRLGLESTHCGPSVSLDSNASPCSPKQWLAAIGPVKRHGDHGPLRSRARHGTINDIQ
jgi:hypothetical protein